MQTLPVVIKCAKYTTLNELVFVSNRLKNSFKSVSSRGVVSPFRIIALLSSFNYQTRMLASDTYAKVVTEYRSFNINNLILSAKRSLKVLVKFII